MKVIDLHKERQAEKEIIIEAWSLLFNRLLKYMEDDLNSVRFVLLVDEPIEEGRVENCFSFNLNDSDVVSFLERSKLSYLLDQIYNVSDE